MSVIQMIRHTMPEPLHVTACKFKLKDQLVHRIYATIPLWCKNKYHYKVGVSKVKNIYFHWTTNGTAIYHLIDVSGLSDEDLKKWEELENAARNYILQCM